MFDPATTVVKKVIQTLFLFYKGKWKNHVSTHTALYTPQGLCAINVKQVLT